MKNARQIEGSGGLEKVSDALLRWRRRSCYGMSQILPNLYVGSMRDANDIDQLKEKQVLLPFWDQTDFSEFNSPILSSSAEGGTLL